MSTAESGRAELVAALRRLRSILEGFVVYYEVPRNHPDAQLILAESRRVFDLIERAERKEAVQ